jgi:hypothetical protein
MLSGLPLRTTSARPRFFWEGTHLRLNDTVLAQLKAAKAIGLALPDSFVLLADEVIE